MSGRPQTKKELTSRRISRTIIICEELSGPVPEAGVTHACVPADMLSGIGACVRGRS